jgi:hypothetical protein
MKFVFALALLFLPGIAHAQVVELQGGVSDFLGNGGGFMLYGPNSEAHFSAGMLNGHFVYGTSEHFEYRKWDVIAGDAQFNLAGGQMSLAVPVRGISVHREGKKSQVMVFTGAVGDVFSSPYFFGIQHAHIGAGFGYKRQLGSLTVGTIQAISTRKTSLGEAEWRPGCNIGAPQPPLAGAGAFRNCWWKNLRLHAQAGLLQSNPQLGGDAGFTTRHVGLSANRSTYIFNVRCAACPPVAAPRVTTNSFSAYGGYGFLNASASLFESTLSRGTSLNVGAHFNWFQVQGSDYKSGKMSSQLLTVTEHGLHWTISEFITRSNGTWNYNVGLSYASNRFSFQTGYSVLYFPLLRNPFQKVLNVQFSFRVRSASVNAATVVQPNGKTQWMTGADDYLQTRMHVPAIGTGDTDAIHSLPQYGHGGKYCFEIYVVDTNGRPVEGASLVLGNDSIFTDSQGRASTRQKHKAMPLRIDLNNFMLPGTWECVECPNQATAGERVTITVKRKP